MKAETDFIEKRLWVGKNAIPVNQYKEDYQVGYNPPVLVPIYDSSFLNYLIKLWQYRVNQCWSVDVMITGDRRVGKSTLASILASMMYKIFSVNNIAFKIEQFQEILRSNPVAGDGIYPVAILDEAGFDMFAQEWADQLQKEMVKAFEIIGAKYQTIFLLAPNPSLINRGLRKMASYWIYLPSEKMTRGVAEYYEVKVNKYDGSIYYDPQCAFLFDPIDQDHNNHLLSIWKEYEKRKMEFIEDVLGRSSEIKGKREQTNTIRLYKLMQWLNNELKVPQTKIAEVVGVDHSTVSYYIERVEK